MAKIQAAASKRDPIPAMQAGPATQVAEPDYNCIVIVLDDIGIEWFQRYAVGELYTTDEDFQYCHTPFLDECMEAGIQFMQGYAESVCSPTRAAVNIGRLMQRTGVGFNMRDPSTNGGPGTDYPTFGYSVPASETFLAEHLRATRPEIETGAFGKWHMADGYTSTIAVAALPSTPPNTNLTDYAKYGYQTWTGNIYNVGGGYDWWKIVDGTPTYISAPPYNETTYPTAVHSAAAATWLAARTGPFFAYIAFGPPHDKFTVPPSSMLSRAETILELAAAGLAAGDSLPNTSDYNTANFPLIWRAAMEATDTGCRRIWEALSPEQQARTYLFVTGDNGTVGNALVPGFVHQKRELFAGGTQVPFIVRGPSVKSPGRQETALVHSVDIFATVCEIMRVPISGTVGQDSVSMMPLIKQSAESTREFIYSQSFRPMGETNYLNWTSRQRAIFDGRWRYVDTTNTQTLYDRLSDPLEETNVATTYPDEVTRLSTALDAYVAH